MYYKDLPIISFNKALIAIRQQPLYKHPSAFLWRKSLSIRNQFCEAVIHAGYLSWDQMVSAACRYCVGATKHGGVIFWQIDHEGRVHDGKVMYYLPDCHRNKSKEAHPTWVSTLLARRDPFPSAPHQLSHVFFGTHLLANTNLSNLSNFNSCNSCVPSVASDQRSSACNSCSKEKSVSSVESVVAIVEAEKSAVILSELYPQYIWLASGGLGEVQPDKFRPLRGRKIILFPDTDPEGIAFRRWSEAAGLVMHSSFWEDSPPIRVSPLLELHATPSQKSRKIDLVDYIFEGHTEIYCHTEITENTEIEFSAQTP